jgi:hypothetical protein
LMQLLGWEQYYYFSFFQFCDVATLATIISEDSTKISYWINRDLRFFFPKCFYNFFNLHKSREFKYDKLTFNSFLFWDKFFENYPKKPPMRKLQLISKFHTNWKLGKIRSFVKIGLRNQNDRAPIRTPTGPPWRMNECGQKKCILGF